MKQIIVYITLFISSNAFAETSLGWQQINLETRINNKVESILSSLLLHDEFNVNTKIKYFEQSEPTFNDANTLGVRPSDSDLSAAKGDYIAFSKVGLELPALHKYYNDNQTKLKEIYQFNKLYDLIANIESYKIAIFVDKSVPKERITKAEAIIKKMDLHLGEAQPIIKFESIELKRIPDEIKLSQPSDLNKEKNKTDNTDRDKFGLRDIFNWISKLGTGAGIVLASIISGIFLIIALKKYFAYLAEVDQSNNAQPSLMKDDDKDDEDQSSDNDDSIIQEDEMLSISFDAQENFNRFTDYYTKHTNLASLLVKKWIHESGLNEINALNSIAIQMNESDLNQLFCLITDNEREKWKSMLKANFKSKDIEISNQYIADEVIKDLVSPQLTDDHELINMIIGLTPEDGLSFIEENNSFTPTFMNIITPKLAGAIINEAESEMTNKIIDSSISLDPLAIDEQLPKMKIALHGFLNQRQLNPFGQKLVTLLDSINIENEDVILDYLLKNNQKATVKGWCNTKIPASLVLDLSDDTLSEILQQYSSEQRTNLLLTVDSEIQERLIDLSAQKGTTAREMLDMDMRNISANESKLSLLNEKKHVLWQDFIKYTRDEVSKNENYKSEVSSLVSIFINKYDKKPQLKVAA